MTGEIAVALPAHGEFDLYDLPAVPPDSVDDVLEGAMLCAWCELLIRYFRMNKRRFTNTSLYAVTAGLLILGIVLRAYNFWVPPLWIDEYGTWFVIAGGWKDVLHRAFNLGGQSPFYYVIVKSFTEVFGVNAMVLRLPSVLFGIGILIIAYPLAARLFKDLYAAVTTSAAFAVSHLLIWYSQDARPYSLALLCTMLSFWFYLSLLNGGKLGARLGYALSTAAVFYAHYIFSFIVAIQAIYLTVACGIRSLTSRAWASTALILGIVCLPGLVHLWAIFHRREAMDWVSPQNELFASIKTGLIFLDPMVFTAVAVSVLVIGINGRQYRNKAQQPMVLLAMWLFLPIIMVATVPSVFGVNLLHPRYFLYGLLAALLILGKLMASVKSYRLLHWIPLAVFLVFTMSWNLVPALEKHQTFSNRFNQDWRKSARILDLFVVKGDLVCYQTGFVEADLFANGGADPLLRSAMQWPLHVHMRGVVKGEWIGLPWSMTEETKPYLRRILQKVKENKRVWFVGVEQRLSPIFKLMRQQSGYQVRQFVSGEVPVYLLSRPL